MRIRRLGRSWLLGAGLLSAASAFAQKMLIRNDGGPIAYLTDVEGRWEKFASALKKSDRVLYLDADGRLQLREGARFVYGGDAVDHGPSAMRVVENLVDLKERYGDRVALIMGNRDLNKMAIPFAMSAQGIAEYRAQLKRRSEKLVAAGKEPLSPAKIQELTSRTSRMQSALRAAPEALEFRRQELETMRGRPVTPEDAVEDILKDLGPGGRFRRFLELGQLVYRPTGQGANALFVHGAVADETLGFVPGRPERIQDLNAWAKDLNAWYSQQVHRWIEAPTEVAGFDELMKYGTGATDESVVFGRYSDRPGNPVLPAPSVIDWLAARKIQWVFGGHTPQDHVPSVLKGGRVNFVLGDNTYADHGSVVELSPDGQSVRIKSEFGGPEAGALVDRGVEHELSLSDRSPIGQRIAGTNLLVKGRLADGRWLATEILPGFKVRREVLAEGDLRTRRLELPSAPVGAPSAAPCGVLMSEIVSSSKL